MLRWALWSAAVLVQLSFILSESAQGQEIWNGLQHGASMETISTTFPEVGRPEDDRPFLGRRTAAVLDGVQVADMPFRAHFILDDQGLLTVELRHPSKLKKKQVKKGCQMLVQHLHGDHGGPVSTVKKGALFDSGQGYEFVDGPRRISLNCAKREAAGQQIKIKYRVPHLVKNATSPHGIRMGMAYAEIWEFLPQDASAEDLGVEDRTKTVVYDVVLDHSSDPRDPEAVKVKVRVSNTQGVCGFSVTASQDASTTDESIRITGRIAPDRTIYGLYDSSDHDFGLGGVVHIPKTSMWMPMKASSMFFKQTWNSSEQDPLPGHVDTIEFIMASVTQDNGDEKTIFKTKYRFDNYRGCGLTVDWDSF